MSAGDTDGGIATTGAAFNNDDDVDDDAHVDEAGGADTAVSCMRGICGVTA